MKSVGYRQMWSYLAGDLDQSSMRERAIIATRQLAKRQLTWLRRRWSQCAWYDASEPDLLERVRARITT